MKRRVRTYSGSLSAAADEREAKNRALVRRAAAEGMVLLKNDGALPLKEGLKAAVYGSGFAHVIKGGTGSGDVNEREVVSLGQGLKDDGVVMVNEEAALSAPSIYEKARVAWRDSILEQINAAGTGSEMGFNDLLALKPFRPPVTTPIIESEVKEADTVIYCISRIAGEGKDREAAKGDYYLSEEEEADLKTLFELGSNIVVLVNAGGQIDLSGLQASEQVKAILDISQPGMEAGHSVADVLTGKVSPSGKLTDTWAVHYEDYPASKTFSHNDGNVDTEKYTEGIYVGYRYFDSFGIPVLYPFGYGLSYTEFSVKAEEVKQEGAALSVSVSVENTGKRAGKEVVQIYCALPQDTQKKELRRLVGFGKTAELAPGEKQTLKITVSEELLASFRADENAWVIEKGEYALFTGTSLADAVLCAVLDVEEECAVEKTTPICPLKEDLTEIVRPDEKAEAFEKSWKSQAKELGITAAPFVPVPVAKERTENPLTADAQAIADRLSDEEVTALLMGEITKGQDNLKENELVETGIYVPGAAGETTNRLEEKYNVPAISMADGPAGLRLLRSYDVDRATGKIYSQSLLAALEGGLFALKHEHENADTYYMYATAIPIGTLLARTWNTDLVEELGRMIGSEMELFGVAWWLAPGMNIHRDPLCGRNFEYYSEDPLVAGVMAAAMTKGVQSNPGVGTTIKHFACNSQEDNRMATDSIVSERALREIYLRGFEIAVRSSQPMCIMTSYNLVNGVHSANNKDLLTTVARGEWGYEGSIMTDWTTTTAGSRPASSYGCALAGNDLIMPGNQKDVDEIRTALADGTLPEEKARQSCMHLIRTLMQTNGYEDSIPYGTRYALEPFVKAE